MNKKKRKITSIKAERNAGAISYELEKTGDQKINPIEMQEAIHKGNKSEDSWENQIDLCLKRGMEFYPQGKDFFLVVLFKKERMLTNIVRQQFFYRLSCPTPSWDQVVYKYHRKECRLEFIWVVPDKESCMNLPNFIDELPDEQKALINYAKAFNHGALDEQCALLNGELVA